MKNNIKKSVMRIRAAAFITAAALYLSISGGLHAESVPQSTNHEPPTISSNPFRYSGYYQDDETGMYYLKARYYDPETMRFTTMDTYDLPNRYNYCDSDPVNNIDPEGHKPKCKHGKVGLCLMCILFPEVEAVKELHITQLYKEKNGICTETKEVLEKIRFHDEKIHKMNKELISNRFQTRNVNDSRLKEKYKRQLDKIDEFGIENGFNDHGDDSSPANKKLINDLDKRIETAREIIEEHEKEHEREIAARQQLENNNAMTTRQPTRKQFRITTHKINKRPENMSKNPPGNNGNESRTKRSVTVIGGDQQLQKNPTTVIKINVPKGSKNSFEAYLRAKHHIDEKYDFFK